MWNKHFFLLNQSYFFKKNISFMFFHDYAIINFYYPLNQYEINELFDCY